MLHEVREGGQFQRATKVPSTDGTYPPDVNLSFSRELLCNVICRKSAVIMGP